MKLCICLIILFHSVSTFAIKNEPQVPETPEQAWAATGYSYEHLFYEAEFQPERCLQSQKLLSACLLTLNKMLDFVWKNQTRIDWDENQKRLITRTSFQGEISDSTRRDEFFKLYDNSVLSGEIQLDSLKKLFAEVRDLVVSTVGKRKQSMHAGESYSFLLTQVYDPDTAFFPANSHKPKASSLIGIGVGLAETKISGYKKEKGFVVHPLPGSPAEKAGMKSGDVIVKINNQNVSKLTLDEAQKKILGEAGEQILLSYHSLCQDRLVEVVIQRELFLYKPDWRQDSKFLIKDQDPIARICEANAASVKKDSKVMYLPLRFFFSASDDHPRVYPLCREFSRLHTQALNDQSVQGIVVDLRGNPGGALHEVSCMLDTIISADRELSVGFKDIQDGAVIEDQELFEVALFKTASPVVDMGRRHPLFTKKVVVLVDQGSASASEVFAGVLQEMQRGWVIGDRTFGKGAIQPYRDYSVERNFAHLETIPESLSLAGKAPLLEKSTVGVYTLPSGYSPQGVGIFPDLRYNFKGEKIVFDQNYVVPERKKYLSIQGDGQKWVHPRPETRDQVSQCALAPDRLNQQLKQKMQQDERYSRPFVVDYQLQLAMDVMSCDQQEYKEIEPAEVGDPYAFY